jgi:putative transposase
MNAVTALMHKVGAVRACAVLGVSRASWYRSQRELAAPQPRPAPPLALSAEQREEVMETLHSPRFVDQAPSAV